MRVKLKTGQTVIILDDRYPVLYNYLLATGWDR